MKKALLFSGGIDSTAIAYWQRPDLSITIDYGQIPAAAEIDAASTVCKQLGIEHQVVSVNCRSLGSGSLAGSDAMDIAPAPEWWPYRNQLLVTLASSLAIKMGISRLLVGTVSSDGFHTDGTPAFMDAISRLLSLQEGHLGLEAPAIHMTSTELVRRSEIPHSLLAWAHSCHTGNFACGNCRGCYKHISTMKELGFVAT